MTRFQSIAGDERLVYAQAMRALGAHTTYPLGEDRFAIDRGDDFFAFVDRLGWAEYDLAWEDDALVGMGCSVRMTRPLGGQSLPCWYLCDLKAGAESTNPVMSLRLFAHGLARSSQTEGRGYLISMNPGTGPNRVTRMLQRVSAIAIQKGPSLNLFSLSAAEYVATRARLEEHRGPLSLCSLRGVKDIVLQSTGQPMELWHVHWGDAPIGQRTEPHPAGVHMFCVPDGDPLLEELIALGLRPHATATVLHSGMEAMDWGRVLTSEI